MSGIFRNIKTAGFMIFTMILAMACIAQGDKEQRKTALKAKIYDPVIAETLETAIFASGCFWCTEAVFERVQGVEYVISGYSGGVKSNPTYEEVSYGRTEYAEAVKVWYDPGVVSYKELVEVFFGSHDPTQLNRQGPDVGPQYRSAIFYQRDKEKEIAEDIKSKLETSGKYNKPIVTEITEYSNFYNAEDYHQDYYELYPTQPYVFNVSRPKVEKFEKEFIHLLKPEYKE